MNVTAKHGQAAVHLASREINNAGHYASACGIGATANSRFTVRGYKDVQKLRPTDKAVTCKRCLKVIEKAEYLGLHLKVVDNEDGSSKVVDTREEAAPEPQAEAPAVDEHAAAVARMYANIDAEEERRAAARRARNRTNYASTPVLVIDAETSPKARKSHSVGRKLAQDHGLNFF